MAILIVPIYTIMANLGLIDTKLSLIIAYCTVAVPFCAWMMRGYFDTIPRELDEAAHLRLLPRFAPSQLLCEQRSGTRGHGNRRPGIEEQRTAAAGQHVLHRPGHLCPGRPDHLRCDIRKRGVQRLGERGHEQRFRKHQRSAFGIEDVGIEELERRTRELVRDPRVSASLTHPCPDLIELRF